MNNRERIEILVREHHDAAIGEFKALTREVTALRKEVRTLRRLVAEGDQQTFPWFRLPPARMRQVEAVVDVLRAHPDLNIPKACQLAYRPVPNGYPSAEALAAYCYANDIAKFTRFG